MSEAPACVFCGEPIGPDQPTAGRPPMAAHATCADAALASDTHWDAIAGDDDGGDGGDQAEDVGQPVPAHRAGCLGVLVVGALVLASMARRRRP